MGISDGDAGFMVSYDITYTTRDDAFADIHNLDQCINYLNQSLVSFGFSSELDFYSSDPASIVRTCNCMYALIQQRQQDIEFRETANETRQRLLSDLSTLEAKVEMLTSQLASEEREMQLSAITDKGPGLDQDASATVGATAPFRQLQSQTLRHEHETELRENIKVNNKHEHETELGEKIEVNNEHEHETELGEKIKVNNKYEHETELGEKVKVNSKHAHETELGEKIKVDNKMRQWHDSRPKTPVKNLPPRSPSRPKTPAPVKRTLGVDCALATPRSRFSEKAVSTALQVDISTTVQKKKERLKKILDFELRKPLDIVEDSITSTAVEQIAQCSGSLLLPDESIFLSPLIQYDNPMYQEDSPPLSARLKSLEINMRALSPIHVNVDPVRPKQEFSPCKPSNGSHDLELSNVSAMTSEFENLTCTTPKRELTLYEQESSTSGSLTPFQQFKHQNPELQMKLVKQYLTVLNTATREELLQLKGIGPKRAAVVLELRQHCDEPFKDLQDLKSIGLSEKQAYSIFNSNIVQKVIFPSS